MKTYDFLTSTTPLLLVSMGIEASIGFFFTGRWITTLLILTAVFMLIFTWIYERDNTPGGIMYQSDKYHPDEAKQEVRRKNTLGHLLIMVTLALAAVYELYG